MAAKLKTQTKRTSRRNGKSRDGSRLDEVMIFKCSAASKSAIIQYAAGQRRSYAFVLQQIVDEFIEKEGLLINSK